MFLGLDLGTSELKALLLDTQHRVIGTANAPLTVAHPHPLWSEQTPAQWWEALCSVMDTLYQEQPNALAALKAIGLSGQMHGAVLLGERHEVLRPAILWNDGRSHAECQDLTTAVPSLSAITGNLAMPGFTAPKLLWVKAHEPAVFAQTRKVLLPKDWLRLQLSGDMVSDLSDAAGTLWLDVGKRDWSDTVLAACQLSRDHMPSLVEGSAPSATLLPALSRRWGLPPGLVIAGGAGDNAASAIGMGIHSHGQGFVSLGTSGVVFVAGASFTPNPAQAVHAFCHALPNRWHQMSVMLSAASALTWAKQTLGFDSEADLLVLAASLTPSQRAQAPLFLPYLSGERSPHNHATAKATWFGINSHHSTADLAYAVAEGVGFGLRDGLDTLALCPTDALSVVGGGTRSVWWLQLLASIFQRNLQLLSGAQTGAALGAARLGWLATLPQTDESIAHVCIPPKVEMTFTPASVDHSILNERYQGFRALYQATKHLM